VAAVNLTLPTGTAVWGRWWRWAGFWRVPQESLRQKDWFPGVPVGWLEWRRFDSLQDRVL